MIENFIPINFLSEEDIKLMRKTQKRINEANKIEDVEYYEEVLDLLMKKSILEYRKK